MKACDMKPGHFYSMKGTSLFLYKYRGKTGMYVCGEDGDEDTQSAFAIEGDVEVSPRLDVEPNEEYVE